MVPFWVSAFLVSAVAPGYALNSEDLELREIACDSCLSAFQVWFTSFNVIFSRFTQISQFPFLSFWRFISTPGLYLPHDKITGFFATTSSSLLNYWIGYQHFLFVPLETKDFKTQVITHYSPSILCILRCAMLITIFWYLFQHFTFFFD